MATFVRIVERGSLTAAAASLGASLPAVVRTLAALEADLGVRLLARTTRRIALTDEGREYVERAKRVLSEVEDADAAMSARRSEPRGRLRVTAPVLFGRLHVAPLLAAFVQRHPAVEVDLMLVDRVVDLVEEGIDVGVRIGKLPDSSMVALAVGETARVACASPAYLARAGTPREPQDLAAHRVVSFGGLTPGATWTFTDPTAPRGRGTASVRVQAAFTTNQVDAALDACERGLGVGRFLAYQVRAAIASRRLVRVLERFEPPPLPIHAIYPQARLLSGNVRAFLDFAVPRLRARDADRRTGTGAGRRTIPSKP